MKVMHVIPTLGQGGAERSLVKVVLGGQAHRVESEVVCLLAEGPLKEELEDAGVRVHCLRADSNLKRARLIANLRYKIRQFDPDVIQTWMYHADLLGGLTAKACRVPVIWNVRHASLGGETRWTTRLVARLCATLSSRIPRAIVCVSGAARDVHEQIGYEGSRIIEIPNGYDAAHPPLASCDRQALRRSLGIADQDFVFIHVGRYHRIKGHDMLIGAASQLRLTGHTPHFLLVGSGVDEHQRNLVEHIDQAGLSQHVHLLGARSDVDRLFRASDVLVSSSLSEAFPNVILEAMAHGLPCVATDVGPCREILRESGWLAEPCADGLAAALQQAMNLPLEARRTLGLTAQGIVRERYSMDQMVQAYLSLYLEAYHSRRRGTTTAEVTMSN